MVKFNLKESLKALILAPAVAGLSGFATYLVAYDSSTLSGSAISATNAPLYAVAVGAIVFAVVLVSSLDKIIEE